MRAFSIFILWIAIHQTALAVSSSYPRIDISGYKSWQYRDVCVSPQSNYAAGLTALGDVSPSLVPGPWQERLQLKALAEMSKELRIIYDVEQQPEVPDRYDVRVNYNDEYELTFGDLTADFEGNEFATATKYLNGMMLTGKRQNYDITLVPAAKLKSTLQERQEQRGKNTKGPYSLGHGYILEGSERVELNNTLLKRGVDYTIDYFEGKITFTRIINQTDTFSYAYEYSNIADLFFPALSRKDFFGLQGRVKVDPSSWGWGAKKPSPRPIISRAAELFPTADKKADSEILEKEAAGKFTLKNTPVERFSETVTFQGRTLMKDYDYRIDYEKGEITLFLPQMVSGDNPMSVAYDYFESGVESDNIAGDGSRGPYDLSHKNIVVNSEDVLVDGNPVSGREYVIDYENGTITFVYNISNTSSIIINYRYRLFEEPPETAPATSPYQLTIGGTYLRESARRGGGTVTADFVDSFSGSVITGNNNTVYLTYFPMVPTAEGGSLTVKKDGVVLTAGTDYLVPSATQGVKLPYINDPADPSDGYVTGTIKILATVEAASEVVVLYTYYKNIYGRFTGGGNGGRGPYYLSNFHNLVPGSEKVEVWESGCPSSRIYARNSSFESDAGDLGYSINYDKENPYLMFNRELRPSQKFTAHFQYLPPATTVSNNLERDVTGLDVDY